MALSSSYGYMSQSGFDQYKANDILTATPERLVVFLYDQAIKGCKLSDSELATKALIELIDSLNFNYADMASRLFRLYEFCLESVRKKQFDHPTKILSELRETWITAISTMKAA
jgi:flagellar secretion chaperone FliS